MTATVTKIETRRKLRPLDFQLMNVGRRYWDVRWDRIQKSLYPTVLAYLRRLDDALAKGDGLLFFGKYGVGKTCAMICLAKEARRRGYTVYFGRAPEIRKALIQGAKFNESQTLADRMKSVDLLIIDDLGKEYTSPSGHNEMEWEELLRNRVANMKSTLMTSNMRISSLAEKYKPSMLEVMKEAMVFVQATGKDMRIAEADKLEARTN